MDKIKGFFKEAGKMIAAFYGADTTKQVDPEEVFSTLDYLEDIGNLSIPAPDLPYILLEEFQDEEKIRLIKRRIK